MDETRYARQTALPRFGTAAQARLRNARVTVVGAGGLGSPVVAYLAGAGVGYLVIVDDDDVDRTNLHRQVIYTDGDAGRPKAALAARFARQLNPDTVATGLVGRVRTGDAVRIAAAADAVVDCSDNLPTRYALNAACVQARVPYVWAAIGQYCGRCSTVLPGAPCYECLLGPLSAQPDLPPASVTGVFGPVCGALGALAAAEAVKVLTGVGRPLAGRLVSVDTLAGELSVIDIAGDPTCPVCVPALDKAPKTSTLPLL